MLTAITATLIAGTAHGTTCKSAKSGTHLSNVCWLFEDLPGRKNQRIVDADRKGCTIGIEKDYLKRVPVVDNPKQGNFHDWDYRKVSERYTLLLDRVNLTESTVEWNKSTRTTCLRLNGDGINDYDAPLASKNTYRVCGRKARVRVLGTVRNLYEKYCRSRNSEF